MSYTFRPAADGYRTVHEGSAYIGSIRPGGDNMLLVYLPGGGHPIASRGTPGLAAELLHERRFDFTKIHKGGHAGVYAVTFDGEPVGEVRLEERPGRSNQWHAFHTGATQPVATGSSRLRAAMALEPSPKPRTARSVTPGYDGPEGTPWGEPWHPGKATTVYDGEATL